jgi:acyl-CoA synthetase (AMP-forming)/AMP-acid ligase II
MTLSIDSEFGTIAELIHQNALRAPHQRALVQGARSIDYATLDAMMDRTACALQRDGFSPGDAIAICADMSIEYAAVFLGALRMGVAVAPLAPGSGAASLQRMLQDAQAKLLFTDAHGADAMGAPGANAPACIALDGSDVGRALEHWLAPQDAKPVPVKVQANWAFNIIYSSGTTGEPKGIVQSHGMRWSHVQRGAAYGYGADTVTLLSTPLYSNTTLVIFFPTLSFGGCVVLMPKFDALGYLKLAKSEHVTHTMLVPVQYQRLLAHPEFDQFDLSSYRVKFSTSAPFAAALKADALKRWPGALIEFYGMTEGGGTCILDAAAFPDKLHTVGRPAEGHDMRLINEQDREVDAGEIGEVVGHSAGMMTGYHGQPEKTRETEWFDPQGKRFIRTGDVGRFDAEGFLTLIDRKKDMLISGGFNVYPSDLEAVLRRHPRVFDAAVVGVPSLQWGETPAAFVVLQAGPALPAQELMDWVNAQVGRTQRLGQLQFIDALPRSPIGKVLKRELRDGWTAHETVARMEPKA